MTIADDSQMKYAATSPPGMFTLVLVTGLSVLSLNMFLPSLLNIANDFQTDYALVSFSVTGYLAATAALQLIMGPLSDRFGRRPVMLFGLVIFVLASLGCMLSSNIGVFLFFRVMQGAISSAWVVSLAIIRDISPERETASRIGYVSMAMAIAPMLGPIFGGLLDELFGWRSNFLVFAVLGTVVFSICWFDLGETNRSPSETIVRQFKAYPELFRSRRFWGYTLCIMFSTGAFYVFLAGVPLVAETFLALSPTRLGFYMGTITAGFTLGCYLSGRYTMRYQLTSMMITGRVVACVGLMAGLALFFGGFVHVASLFGATVFVGLGNGLTMPSANAGALSVRPRLAGSASGLKGALTVGGGAVLSSITGIILTKQHGAYQLLGLMLFCALMGLIAALYVRHIDRCEAHEYSNISAR